MWRILRASELMVTAKVGPRIGAFFWREVKSLEGSTITLTGGQRMEFVSDDAEELKMHYEKSQQSS
jgi:hypothetical protein